MLGASDGAPSGKFNVDYPSADPYVMGTSGTRLKIRHGEISEEVAWNCKKGATGGGISTNEVPEYQDGLRMQANANHTHIPGRGVPDIAADADPLTGYIIRVHGREVVMGRNSTVFQRHNFR